MATPTSSSSLSLVFVRLFIAWAVGGALYFFTAVATSYDGFNTFVSGILGGAFISAVAVGACAILGLLLLIPRIGRFWCASYVPVASVGLLGLVLFAFSFVPGQLKELGPAEDGGTIKELGQTWLPGYLLLLFVITTFPLPSRPTSTAVA